MCRWRAEYYWPLFFFYYCRLCWWNYNSDINKNETTAPNAYIERKKHRQNIHSLCICLRFLSFSLLNKSMNLFAFLQNSRVFYCCFRIACTLLYVWLDSLSIIVEIFFFLFLSYFHFHFDSRKLFVQKFSLLFNILILYLIPKRFTFLFISNDFYACDSSEQQFCLQLFISWRKWEFRHVRG